MDAARPAIRSVAERSRGPSLPAHHRITLNFHPDAVRAGLTIIEALAYERVYRSQFETGVSNGGLTAFVGGDRWEWESRIFGGVYDNVSPELRPKYGALNYRQWQIGGSPRFGSCHLRLAAHMLQKTTFCYPDSHLNPRDFGVSGAMNLIVLAEANAAGLDLLDDYIEAHVHGVVDLGTDVEAIVLDPSYMDTEVEVAAAKLPCPLEWHEGFRLKVQLLNKCRVYRGEPAAGLLAGLAQEELVTPQELGRARGHADPQVLKQAWHCLARFGSPLGS